MKTIIKVQTWLPLFPGFYGTSYQYNDDDMEYKLFSDPNAVCQELKDIIENEIYDCIDYDDYKIDVSKACCDFLDSGIREIPAIAKIVKSIKFGSLVSPKEYNFANNSINCIMELDFNALLTAFIKHPKSKEYLKGTYTSCSGFMSHYPNNMPEWIENAFDDKGHTTGSMLQFLLIAHDETIENDMIMDVLESVENDYIDYDKLLKAVNTDIMDNHPLSEWIIDMEDMEGYEFTDTGNRFIQLLTGVGLFETDPETLPLTDFQNNYGLNLTN